MLTQRLEEIAAFTRRDAARLGISAIALVVVLTAIMGVDFFPQPLRIAVGGVAASDIVAPRALEYVSDVQTEARRAEARERVEAIYDYTTEKAIRIAGQQLAKFEQLARPVDQAFEPDATPEEKETLLLAALPGISDAARTTARACPPQLWRDVPGSQHWPAAGVRAGRASC